MDADTDKPGQFSAKEKGRKRSGAGPTSEPTVDGLREGARAPATAQAIDLLSIENRVLKLIATDRPLQETLDALVGAIETHCEGATAAVWLMSDDGQRLSHGSARGLPAAYIEAMDGLRIGPRAGSCGTAAYRGEPVIVTDTANDPLWVDFVALVEQYELRACWAQPIFSADREVLGTLAMYRGQPQAPAPVELKYIEVAAHLAGIAIARERPERTRMEEGRRPRERSTALARLARQAYRATEPKRHRARESDLAEVSSDFKRFFESSLDLMCVAGTDGYFRRVNPAFERVLGYTGHELTAEPCLQFVHPDDRQGTREELDMLSRSQSAVRFVNRYRCRDGSYRWLEWSAVSAPQEDALYAVARDLTDRIESEERLRQLSNAVEQTDDSVFITERDGTINYVNRAFEVTTGYSREEALGRSPRILKSGKQDGEYYRRLWETILRGDVYRGEVVNRKRNGELYYAEQTITPIKGPDGGVARFVSVVKDMTERRESQRRALEMELASRVQRRLYPEAPPRLDGFDLAGAVFSAQATCGDYFDFIDMKDRSLGIAVGDVCGHGFGPALLMAETRAYLRSLARVQSHPGEILGSINDILASDFEDNRYVTMILACLDPSTRSLTWVNAGHIPGYVLDRSGAVKAELSARGLPLGMFHGSKYRGREDLVIQPGEVVVLLTDGITELEDRSGGFFGPEAVLEVIRTHPHESAARLVARVREAVEQFRRGHALVDDMTIVICKRLPAD